MASMDYDTYKELEQNMAEAIEWAEDVSFSVDMDAETKDVILIAEFYSEDDDGVNQPVSRDRYKLVKIED